MADPVWQDNVTPLNAVNMTKLQTRDEKAVANGYPSLDATGKVPAAQLPPGLPAVVNGQWLKGVGGAAVWSPITAADVSGLASHQTANIAAANTDLPWSGGSAPVTYLNILAGGGSLRSLGAPPNDGQIVVIRANSAANPFSILFNTTGAGARLATLNNDNPSLVYPMTIAFVYDSAVTGGPYWLEVFRSAAPPQYVTALPAVPADGQEVYLCDSLTTPTWTWHLRYSANSTSLYKWYFLGGNHLRAVNAGLSTALAASAWGVMASPLSAPRAGVYDVTATSGLQIAAAGTTYGSVSASTSPQSYQLTTTAQGAGALTLPVTDQVVLAAGAPLNLLVWTQQAGATLSSYSVHMVPVRVS